MRRWRRRWSRRKRRKNKIIKEEDPCFGSVTPPTATSDPSLQNAKF
jgi:hypothetical protein